MSDKPTNCRPTEGTEARSWNYTKRMQLATACGGAGPCCRVSRKNADNLEVMRVGGGCPPVENSADDGKRVDDLPWKKIYLVLTPGIALVSAH
jgi:hypothetical protein